MGRRAPGRLRVYLDFQKDTRSKATDGHEGADWTSQAKRFGTVDIMRGAERWEAQALLGTNPMRIKVRYDNLLANILVDADKWRILRVVDSTVYEVISAIDTDLRKRWIEIDAKLGTAVQDG